MSGRAALEQLVRETPGLWRGRDHRAAVGGDLLASQSDETRSGGTRSAGIRSAHAIDTGHAELNALLPTGGWPRRAVIEIVVDDWGNGELQPLLPLMARLTHAGRQVALVAPPFQPCAPALVQAGIDLANLLVVVPGGFGNMAGDGAGDGVGNTTGNESTEQDIWWAAEKLLRQGDSALVLLWPGRQSAFRASRVRRLQLAADRTGGIGVILGRGPATDSPVGLRLHVARRGASFDHEVAPQGGAVAVTLTKSRYGWCHGEVAFLPGDFRARIVGQDATKDAAADIFQPVASM